MALKAIDDVFFTWDATELRYRIRIEGLDEIIYEGKAFAKPNSDTIKINVSRIARNYLENDLPCIGDPEDDYSYVCNEAYKNFLIDVYYPETDTWQEEDAFDFLWYYDNTNEIPYKLSDPVNGHSAIGVKNLLTTWDASNGVETSVKTSDELVGCEIKESGGGGGGGDDPTPTPDYRNYLTFNIKTDGTIVWIASDRAGVTPRTLQYQKNGGEWISITSSLYPGTTINVNAGDVIKWRGNNVTTEFNSFRGSASYDLSGNIMSLLNPTDFENMTSFPSNQSSFAELFFGANVLDASRLILPAKTLTNGCYREMFFHSSLTKAPKLPATTLATMCYEDMFRDCPNLTQAPALPATTLATECYYGMFRDCTGLTTLPSNYLPATTLANDCYKGMFAGCTNLTSAPALPATTLAIYCYQQMFEDCTSLTQAPALPATILPEQGRCYRQMFAGCTSLTEAPELPAKTLRGYCYYGMFSGCSNLNYIKCLATDRTATNCTRDWVAGVADTGTFVKDSNMTGWTIDSVNGIPIGWTIIDEDSGDDSGYTFDYLTIEAISGNSVEFSTDDENTTLTVYYKINDGSWTALTSLSGSVESVSLNTGDKMYLKATGNVAAATFRNRNSGKFKVYGNIMSLIYGDDFSGKTDLRYNAVFGYLFKDFVGLVDASKLILPSPVVTPWGYSNMFDGCTSLITAPKLPATNLSSYCYRDMFNGCTSLILPPAIPAVTVGSYACWRMFYNCTSLTRAAQLPATNLAPVCYDEMFAGCTGLTTAYVLPATTLYHSCYGGMFAGCSSLVSVPSNMLPATVLASSCYMDMFYNCTSLTQAPDLPATTTAQQSCYQMFRGCTSLTTAPKLPATTLATYCYENMFMGCSSLVSVPSDMLPATTLAAGCYSMMFSGCTSLTTAPELPATTLANYCYEFMFNGCTSLNYIKCLATDMSAYNCTFSWVRGVPTGGTFVQAVGADWAIGQSAIPNGWTVENNLNRMLRSAPLRSTIVVSTSGTVNGYVVCYCGEYALYYQNRRGGWDTFLFEGTCKKLDNYNVYSYSKPYDNTTIEFGTSRYLNTITERWELNSGWLKEDESRRFAHHLLSTNQAYLHILAEDRIIPVVITDSQAEYKTYATNDYKPINYRITVENSQKKYRR